MADGIQHSAVTSIHNAIRIGGPDAVVFNASAAPVDLLAYAHGQMAILDELLLAMQDGDDPAFPHALRSILGPGIAAVEMAASKLLERPQRR